MNEEEDEEGEDAEEEGTQESATGAGRRVTFGLIVLTARNMIQAYQTSSEEQHVPFPPTHADHTESSTMPRSRGW